MKKKKQPAETPQMPEPQTIKLTETQQIALRNTMKLWNDARRQAAEYEKQFHDVGAAAIRDSGHDPDVLKWTNNADLTELIGTPKGKPKPTPAPTPSAGVVK